MRFMQVPFLMRSVAGLTPAATREDAPRVNVFLDAAAGVSGCADLTRLSTRDEAEWQCERRSETDCPTTAGDAPAGAITGYRMRVLDQPRTTCSFIDDVLCQELPEADRAPLLQRFLSAGAKEFDLAVVPVLNYTDMNAFRVADFRRSPRVLNAFLTLWSEQPPELSSLYMDVI